jgi:hypothetical protein
VLSRPENQIRNRCPFWGDCTDVHDIIIYLSGEYTQHTVSVAVGNCQYCSLLSSPIYVLPSSKILSCVGCSWKTASNRMSKTKNWFVFAAWHTNWQISLGLLELTLGKFGNVALFGFTDRVAQFWILSAPLCIFRLKCSRCSVSLLGLARPWILGSLLLVPT